MTGKSTTFDDPNRESIGLAPIWTGAGAPEPEVDPDPEPTPEAKRSGKHKSTEPEVDPVEVS